MATRNRPLIGRCLSPLMIVVLAAGCGAGWAQVVMDGKFGSAGALAGPNYSITSDLGLIRGNNLFHSFARFDLVAGDVAAFSGPGNIQNILGRVTGGGVSSIDGTIRSDIAGANLFLVNPSGIIFGPNAVVNVTGSFAATSANYLRLEDGARFVAALDADDSVLSAAPVSAFGFLGVGGGIEVRGRLTAGPNAGLSLVGGSVRVTEGAHLEAVDGVIHLAGVRDAGEVTDSVPAISSPVAMTGRSEHVDGTVGLAANGGEDVVIRGGRLVVDNAEVSTGTSGGQIDVSLTEGLEVLDGGQLTSQASGAVRGGDIRISARTVVVDGRDGPAPTRIAAETDSGDAEAAGGNIIVNSETMELRRGAEVSVSTFGAADAGRVEITTGALVVEGSEAPQFPTQISANAAPVFGTASGSGGQIIVRADSIEINQFAGMLAATTGGAAAGAITIEAGSVSLNNGSLTTFTAGAGAGGEIRVSSDELTLDGPFASITALTTGLDDQTAAGDGGVISLDVGTLNLLNDSAISANTFGDGNGGNIQITAGSVLLDTATFQAGSIPGITAASSPSFGGGAGGGIL